MPRQLRREEYTVGWVCALPIELAAAQEMLDEEHDELERGLDDNDDNLYALGSIYGHNVAIVCLPAGRIGNNPAATVVAQMRATFKRIRFGLMVGIGGGAPSEDVDIRLGDVVVSQPDKTFGGVVQYDMGKATPSGFERTGSLNSPPQMLLAAVARVQANELRGKSRLGEHLFKLEGVPKFQRCKTGPDVLFKATYDHEGGQTCNKCRADRQEQREPRDDEEGLVVTHYGTIASGNQVIRNAIQRDQVSADLGGVLCFEMEAAGLVNSFPCLVVRGICDYADSHKNKRWQAYASGTAAAWAKEVLSVIPATEEMKAYTVNGTIGTSSSYTTHQDRISQLDNITTMSGKTPSPDPSPVYFLPFSKNRYFVGRSDEIQTLKQRLMVTRDCQKISIVGLGGMGKTQVALHFAYLVKETWSDVSVFWMPALSMESFEQACVSIVRLLQIQGTSEDGDQDQDVKELVRQHLSSARSGRWLLVLDNADDQDILFGVGNSKGIVDYLPESEEGVVVYTTRIQEVAVSLTRGDVLELEAICRKDAFSFLEKSLIRKNLLRDEEAANELLDELTYLPLAIAQAAAYLNKNRTTITKYLRLLRNTEQDLVGLMSHEFRDDTRYRGTTNAVATTWVVSFAQIRERDKAAADLLSFVSCIEWKAIPRSLLPQVLPEERMDEALGTLCGYSFLVRREDTSQQDENEEEWYDTHRLVHLATRIWVKQYGDIADVQKRVIQRTADVFPPLDYAHRKVRNGYLPHALRLLGSTEDRAFDKIAQLCLLVGRCLDVDGRIQEALRWLEESCRLRETLDEADPDRLTSQHELAIAYSSNGQTEKAIELLKHVIQGQKETLVEDHPRQLSSQHELARAYEANGQAEEAVKLLEHIVRVEENLAEDNIDRLTSQHVLVVVYLSNGQKEKALALIKHVAKITEKLAEDDPTRIVSLHVLARAYQADGQLEKAVELFEHVVRVEEKLQDDHPDKLISQYDLALAYQAVNQGDKAIELLEHIVRVEATKLAEGHPSRIAVQARNSISRFQTVSEVNRAATK